MHRTCIARIERADRTYQGGIVRVRLSDGRTIRMYQSVAELLVLTAGRVTMGEIAYSVDGEGNCFDPRPATDADRRASVATTREASAV